MKLFTKLGWVIVGTVFAATNLQAADVSAEQEWQIKAEIKQLVDKYAMARDNLDAVGYASVFTQNGSLVIAGEPFTGREVIQARVEEVDPNSVGMHIMSTSQITVLDDQNATGIHYATVYGAAVDDSHQEGQVIAVEGFVTQGKYFDKYELTDEGWRISERRFERVYVSTP